MKIDLLMVDIFEDSELELDKKITFIFGKNGIGKSTFTEEIKKMTSDYDVSVFQGFRQKSNADADFFHCTSFGKQAESRSGGTWNWKTAS